VDPDDQHILVVGPVEDRDLPFCRFIRMNAPQEIMRQLDRRRLLEIGDLHALRIGAGHDMADRAVLARRVQSLQHDQQRTLGLGIELVLELLQSCDMVAGLCRGHLVILVFAGVGRIEARQFEL
jgi:hypothetical protein